MVEPSVFQILGAYASVDRNDVVLDVGAGFGFLTLFLANRCKSVLAVESDQKIAQVLREQLKYAPNVTVIEDNVLKASIPDFNKVVAIPPYNISSRLLLWLFNRKFDCAVLIFQKEFANRIVAPVGSEDYGWLTVSTYYHAEVKLLDAIPKSMFYPQPKVDSIIVHLKPWPSAPFKLRNEVLFRQMLRFLFTQRNKKVRNALMPFLKATRTVARGNPKSLVDGLPFRNKRVRELAPEDFGALANALCD